MINKKGLFIFAFLLTACLLPVPAAAAKDNWLRLNSQNFTVISNADRKEMSRVATQLETFRAVFVQLFPRARVNSSVPNTVMLFKSHDSFRPFKPKYKGKTQDNVGGYFLRGWDNNYIALTTEKVGRNPFEVIFHEYVHYIINNSMRNAPLWLNEGLAEYYSTFTVLDDEEGKIRIGAPIPWHLITLRDTQLLPLDKLLAVDHKSANYNEGSKAGVFYAESWALVHYLLNGSKEKKRLPQLGEFLTQISAGKTTDEAFQHAFQADYKTIEGELRSYVSKYLFTVLEGRLPAAANTARAEQNAETAQLGEAEAQYHLGNLQQRIGRFDEAVERFEKINQLDGNYAPALVALGAARMRQSRYEEAERLLRSAVEADPKDYLAQFYYGVLQGEQEKYEESVKYLKQSALLKPNSSWIQNELGQACLNAGMEKESDEAYLQALRLDPNNETLAYRRAYSNLRFHRGSQAAAAAIQYINQQGWNDDHAKYLAIVAYYGLREIKKETDAGKVIREALKRTGSSEWVYSVLQYLDKTMTADALLEKAGNDNDQLTEAHAYIGMELLLNGETEVARSHLTWVKEKGNKNFVEYQLAVAELKRVGAEKTGTQN